jgi:hypothetical protein
VPQDTDIARLVQKMDRLDALRDGLEGQIRYAEETMGQRVEESRRKVNRQVGRLIEIRKESWRSGTSSGRSPRRSAGPRLLWRLHGGSGKGTSPRWLLDRGARGR